MNGFEWDENKREINLAKHGLDFIDAIKIFSDNNRIENEVIRHAEKRYQTIGYVNDCILVVVYNLRREKKRIISARLASRKEREIYSKLR